MFLKMRYNERITLSVEEDGVHSRAEGHGHLADSHLRYVGFVDSMSNLVTRLNVFKTLDALVCKGYWFETHRCPDLGGVGRVGGYAQVPSFLKT